MDLDDEAELWRSDDEISVQSFEEQPWQQEEILQSRPGWQNVPPADLSQGIERSVNNDAGGPTSGDYSHLYRLTPIIRVGQAFADTGPWFRFLAIQPGAWLDPISCKLVSRPLFDAPPYDALSYSWGTGPATREIMIDRIGFSVSNHLWKALRRLRKVDRTVNIWVDAICIDQHSAVERTAQVHIMAQIYNQAVNVRVWLGEEDKLPIYSLSDASLFWLLSLDQTPWWKRLWVVQECAYSQKCPIVMLGCLEIDLRELVNRWRIAVQSCDSVEHHRRYWLLNESLPFLEGLCKTWQTSDHRRSLAERLEENSRRQCSNSRDRVYALLSLVDEAEASQVAPDYRITPHDLQLRLNKVISCYPIPKWADIVLMERKQGHTKVKTVNPHEVSDYGLLLSLAVIARSEDIVTLILDHAIVLSVDGEALFSALLIIIDQALPKMLDLFLAHQGCLRAIDRIPEVYDRDDPETTLDPQKYDWTVPLAHSQKAPFLKLLTHADSAKDSTMLCKLLSNRNIIRRIATPVRCRAIVEHAIRNNREMLLRRIVEQPELCAAIRRSIPPLKLLFDACRDTRRNEVAAILAKNYKDVGMTPAVYADAIEIALENSNEQCVAMLLNAADSDQLRAIQFPQSITNMAAVRVLDVLVKSGVRFRLQNPMQQARAIISNAIAKDYVDVAAATFCVATIDVRRAFVTQLAASVFRVAQPRALVAALREIGRDIDVHGLLFDSLTPVAYPKPSTPLPARQRALNSGVRFRLSNRLSPKRGKTTEKRQVRPNQQNKVDKLRNESNEPVVPSSLASKRTAPLGFGRSRWWHRGIVNRDALR